MSAPSGTIRLGGREFALRPLTLGELRPVLDALDTVAGASGGALIDAAARVIQAGLAGAYPELRVEDILGLEATLDEANAAVAAILGTAGLAPLGEAKPAATDAAGPRSPGFYGALATGCGYDYRAIDRLNLAEAGEIFAYWAENPPAHLMLQIIARMLGWAPAAAAGRPGPPPGLPVVPAAAAGFPAPVFDLDTLRRRNRARTVVAARRDAQPC